MKKKITLILALLLMISLSACHDDKTTDEETQKPSDWRNTIEYEGNFYVDSETKLLYALDKGTITLWDNSGNGETLQVLEYNSSESGAIESLSVKDVNGDGANDISTVFSENEAGTKYNLWLWNKEDHKYKAVNSYRNINNPVVSEDGATVTGTLDCGIFGVVTSVYNFTENLTIEPASVSIANADTIAQNISNALSDGAIATLTEGTANIQGTSCTTYVAQNGDSSAAYIAFSPDGVWYIDNGCIGAYKTIKDNNGAFEADFYVDEAGEVADMCAQLYDCDVSQLTITEKTMGTLIRLKYDNEGNPIAISDSQTEPEGEEAKSYTITKDGQLLCIMLKSGNSSYYCLDNNLSGDNYYHMVAASGEAKLVDFTASVYYIK